MEIHCSNILESSSMGWMDGVLIPAGGGGGPPLSPGPLLYWAISPWDQISQFPRCGLLKIYPPMHIRTFNMNHFELHCVKCDPIWNAWARHPLLWLGWNNPYTRSLEARIWASNKEQMYGLVRPNPLIWTRLPTNIIQGEKAIYHIRARERERFFWGW